METPGAIGLCPRRITPFMRAWYRITVIFPILYRMKRRAGDSLLSAPLFTIAQSGVANQKNYISINEVCTCF
jgi:hypothetical protein